MQTLKDVLLYLARHAPASHEDLAAMERVIEHELGPDAAPVTAPDPLGILGD